jgi:YVTN family beta-propeller protein
MKTNKLKACWSPLFGISLWVTAASAPVLGQTPPTYTVLTTITGFNGPVGVAVSPDNNYVYVANGQADTLVVIDAANYSVLQTLNLSESADDVALTPNGKEVYVSAGGNAGPFVINGFNTSTFAPTLTFSGGSPTGIAFSRNGKELFAAQYGASQVNVYDTAGEGSLLSQIPTGADPAQVAITPNGKRAYVTNSYAQYPTGGTVSVIDVGTRKVKGKPITVGNDPQPIAITPNGQTVYVGNRHDATISVIETKHNTVTDTISVATLTNTVVGGHIAVSPDGEYLYVPVYPGGVGENGVVLVISTATDQIATQFPAEEGPDGIAIAPDGNTIYVTNNYSGSMTVVGVTQ